MKILPGRMVCQKILNLLLLSFPSAPARSRECFRVFERGDSLSSCKKTVESVS